MPEIEKKNEERGGKREGSGRKKTGLTSSLFSFRFPKTEKWKIEKIKSEAQKRGITIWEYISSCCIDFSGCGH